MKKQYISRLAFLSLTMVGLLWTHVSLGLAKKANKKRQKAPTHQREGRRANKSINDTQGEVTYTNRKLRNLTSRGYTRLEEVEVTGATKVVGYTQISDSRLNTVESWGGLSVKNSTVKGALKTQGHFEVISSNLENKVDVLGFLQAVKTNFLDDISVASNTVLLQDVTANDIYVRVVDTEDKAYVEALPRQPQMVILAGETLIQGSITFEAENGIVMLGEDAKVEGEVMGGTIKMLASQQDQTEASAS